MDLSTYSMKGRVAIVTGSARGAGRAIAVTLARHGADVVIVDLAADNCRETAQAVEAEGSKSLVVAADVGREADLVNVAARAREAFGGIDILVNNAAVPGWHLSLLDLKPEQWDRTMAVNLKAHWLLAREVVPIMQRQSKGAIVNIASIMAFNPGPLNPEYCVAKAGVVMLTKAMAQQWAPMGIRVNAVAPGLILTEMARHVWTNAARMEEMKRTHPLGRGADPMEIAAIVAYLVSDAASYVNGAIVMATGQP